MGLRNHFDNLGMVIYEWQHTVVLFLESNNIWMLNIYSRILFFLVAWLWMWIKVRQIEHMWPTYCFNNVFSMWFKYQFAGQIYLVTRAVMATFSRIYLYVWYFSNNQHSFKQKKSSSKFHGFCDKNNYKYIVIQTSCMKGDE